MLTKVRQLPVDVKLLVDGEDKAAVPLDVPVEEPV